MDIDGALLFYIAVPVVVLALVIVFYLSRRAKSDRKAMRERERSERTDPDTT